MLVERVGGDGHLDPFAAAGDDRERRRPGVGHPHVVLELGHVLFGRRLFGERPGQHELGLEHGVEVVDEPVQGRRQISMDRVLNPALDVGDGAPGVALVPGPVERLGGDAELDDEVVADRSSGSASPRFSFHSRISAASSGLMMIRASEPPTKWCRLSKFLVSDWVFTTFPEDGNDVCSAGAEERRSLCWESRSVGWCAAMGPT